MNRLNVQAWCLRAGAVFALLWSIFRSYRQAITLDEADTYFWFASGTANNIWFPFPNNHVLNTLLIWLSTHVFGLSTLNVRLPALLGAALYISVAYFLCRAITDRFALQVATFTCLVYNPFVLDFFAAARGYSLANAFLLSAVATPLWHTRAGRASVRTSCAMASAAVALSFASNFAFAFVDLAVLLTIVLWGIRQRGPESMLSIIVCCTVPGLVIALGLCGYPITHYPRNQLWYGARSLYEMTQSLVDASLYQLPPWVKVFGVIGFVERFLLPALGILCLCKLILASLNREWPHNAQARLTVSVAGILIVTLVGHYLGFRLGNIPLPLSRTGIFLLPLCTLLVALIAASPTKVALSRVLNNGITLVFLCFAVHCLLCLRSTYFKEYEWGADVKDVYRVIEQLNQTYGVQDFAANGFYRSSLNFYRAVSGTHAFPPLPSYPNDRHLPPGKPAYVLRESYYQDFIAQQRLAIVYRGRMTEVAVAVPPNGPIPPLPFNPSR